MEGGGGLHGVTQLLGQVGKLPAQKLTKILFRKFFMLKIGLFLNFSAKKEDFLHFFVMASCQLDLATELLREVFRAFASLTTLIGIKFHPSQLNLYMTAYSKLLDV